MLNLVTSFKSLGILLNRMKQHQKITLPSWHYPVHKIQSLPQILPRTLLMQPHFLKLRQLTSIRIN
eukprot:scaffold248438_cov104-Cyclotella_meneghiniana.AAC.7